MNPIARKVLSDYMIERMVDFYDPQARDVDAEALTRDTCLNTRVDLEDIYYFEVLNLAQETIRRAALDYQMEGEHV